MKKVFKIFFACFSILLMVCSCSGGSSVENGGYKVSGTVYGLSEVEHAIVVNNGNLDDKIILDSKTSKFSFKNKILDGGNYVVTVLEQPNSNKRLKQNNNKVCTVNNHYGVNVAKNIENINVVCSSESFKIKGTVIGIPPGQQISLYDSYNDNLIINSNGVFEFTKHIPLGGSYHVIMFPQPEFANCVVNNYRGTLVNKNINNVEVICNSKGFHIGGKVTGLIAGDSIQLVNNGNIHHNTFFMNSDSSYKFYQKVPPGGSYNVSVYTNSKNQVCSVTNGSGIATNKDINDVNILCSKTHYSVGGNVSGLAPGKSLTVMNKDNLNEILTISSNGHFTFEQAIAYGSNYHVVVDAQPDGKRCTVHNGNGIDVSNKVNGIDIVCEKVYALSGNVTGLAPNQSLTLLNIVDGVPYTISSNGYFILPGTIDYGKEYNINIINQPSGQYCAISNGYESSGTYENINDINIVCKYGYAISVNVSGLLSGSVVGGIQLGIILNNTTNGDTVTAYNNGTLSFPLNVVTNGDYNVTASLIGPGQDFDGGPPTVISSCNVTNGFGIATSAVTNINVECPISVSYGVDFFGHQTTYINGIPFGPLE